MAMPYFPDDPAALGVDMVSDNTQAEKGGRNGQSL